MSGAAITQKLSQNQKSKKKSKKWKENVLKKSKYMGFIVFLISWKIIKINQREIKIILEKSKLFDCSAILCFEKPLKTIVANFISKWINYSRKSVSNDLKGFLQGIWALKQDYKDTKLKRYKKTRLQNFKDTKMQEFYFAVSLDL